MKRAFNLKQNPNSTNFLAGDNPALTINSFYI